MNRSGAGISIKYSGCAAVKIRKLMLGRIIPNGEDEKMINPYEKPALPDVVHLGRRKGDETVLEFTVADR